MALPANISTGRVVGQFIVGVVDGPDYDSDPDCIAASGTISFTASAPYLPNPTASPNPVTILKTTIVGVLDDEGYLCTPDPSNPKVAGMRGIRLVATDDPDATVEGWTWRATPRFLNTDGMPLLDVIKPFDFALPSEGTVDLTTVVKVPASPGVGKEQAFQLLTQAEAAAGVASLAAQKAAEDAAVAQDVKRRADAGEFKGAKGDMGSLRFSNSAGLSVYALDTSTGREHLIHGDTGWRNISALCTEATFGANGGVFLKRAGNTVWLNMVDVIATNPGADNDVDLVQLPNGFGARHNVTGSSLVGNTNNGRVLLVALTRTVAIYNMTEGKTASTLLSWNTEDAWPGTLPGTQA